MATQSSEANMTHLTKSPNMPVCAANEIEPLDEELIVMRFAEVQCLVSLMKEHGEYAHEEVPPMVILDFPG
jgi:hypothetical protein